jgi:hypothetical protein
MIMNDEQGGNWNERGIWKQNGKLELKYTGLEGKYFLPSEQITSGNGTS